MSMPTGGSATDAGVTGRRSTLIRSIVGAEPWQSAGQLSESRLRKQVTVEDNLGLDKSLDEAIRANETVSSRGRP